MGWWFKKKKLDEFLTSDEFKVLERKSVEFSTAIDILKAKMDRTETENRSLRSKINNHIFHDPDEEKKTEKSETETNLKPSIFLNPNGDPI